MQFAICNELFEGWDFARQCSFAAEVGYTGLELAPFTLAPRITDLAPEKRRLLHDQAREAGVQIIGLHWLLAKTEGLHLTAEDPDVRRATADYLIELGRACRDLGGHLMVFGSPQQRNLAEGVSTEEGNARAEDVFRRCLPSLADYEVTLCLEPLTPAETNFITSCAEAMALIELLDHPNLRLHLDVKAMTSEDAYLPDLISTYAPQAAHFHANDPNKLGPGFGEVDFGPVFRALKETGYDRWVSVEVFDYSPGPERLARESLHYMQRCLQQVEG